MQKWKLSQISLIISHRTFNTFEKWDSGKGQNLHRVSYYLPQFTTRPHIWPQNTYFHQWSYTSLPSSNQYAVYKSSSPIPSNASFSTGAVWCVRTDWLFPDVDFKLTFENFSDRRLIDEEAESDFVGDKMSVFCGNKY